MMFRAKVHAFVDAEIVPHVLEWEAAEALPVASLFCKAATAGVYAPQWPAALGGTPPGGVDGAFDPFHDLVWVDEVPRRPPPPRRVARANRRRADRGRTCGRRSRGRRRTA
jgi:alkylation response protein AidB-like acyl-CoA dehydrogenase